MRRRVPKYGDTRVRRGFLWLPKRCAAPEGEGGHEWRWLEWASWSEKFIDEWCFPQWVAGTRGPPMRGPTHPSSSETAQGGEMSKLESLEARARMLRQGASNVRSQTPTGWGEAVLLTKHAMALDAEATYLEALIASAQKSREGRNGE